MIAGIFLILLSFIAVPSSISSGLTESLNKNRTYLHAIGFVFFFWGIWGLISAILSVDLLVFNILLWVVLVVSDLLETTLGFFLGYPLLNKYLFSKDAAVKKSGEKIMHQLIPYRYKLKLSGIITGLLKVIIITFLKL